MLINGKLTTLVDINPLEFLKTLIKTEFGEDTEIKDGHLIICSDVGYHSEYIREFPHPSDSPENVEVFQSLLKLVDYYSNKTP